MLDSPDNRSTFLASVSAAREKRKEDQFKIESATKIQAWYRGSKERSKLHKEWLDSILAMFEPFTDLDRSVQRTLPNASDALTALRKLFYMKKIDIERHLFERICRYAILSSESANMKTSLISLALMKSSIHQFIQSIKQLTWICVCKLADLSMDLPTEQKSAALYLHILVVFTATNTWMLLKPKQNEVLRPALNQLCVKMSNDLVSKGLYNKYSDLLKHSLCQSNPAFKTESLKAAILISIRPLQQMEFNSSVLSQFVCKILSIPALVTHLQKTAPESLTLLHEHSMFVKCLKVFSDAESLNSLLSVLGANDALCLMANLLQMAYLQKQEMIEHLLEFTTSTISTASSSLGPAREFQTAAKSLFKKLVLEMSKSSIKPSQRFGSAETTITSLVCCLYQSALSTFTQLTTDILGGLCRDDFLLPKLWTFIAMLGPNNGLNVFLDALANNTKATNPEFQILILFADTAATLLTILDEKELYEQQKAFALDQVIDIAKFCNIFVFTAIWDGLIPVRSIGNHALFNSVHNLCMVIYARDCRKKFTPGDKFWLIRDLKVSSFVSDLRKENDRAQMLLHKIPHILPHKERVQLLRGYIKLDKERLGLQDSRNSNTDYMNVNQPAPQYITVHRCRIVEDGFSQLSVLPPDLLKSTIRVKFVNEQGVNEAGIDQHGVFKEFLEELISKIFDPALSLFMVTSEGRLYPCPDSSIHHNHLALFQFVGRMLAKAIYEGIVVEVPFANFFLSNILGRRFSCLDELPSLDPQLYTNLTFLKHYAGDVSDLCLVFSYDEERLGQIHSHDLLPHGSTIPVTNENRISYMHLVAAYRLHEQIQSQVRAFVHGFRSLLPPSCLAMFSPPELQMLISGAQGAGIDVQDLRAHTHYYGGLHNQHRVVKWLWHILQNDFTTKEQQLFLKFVTSCSKAPLLGFAHLEPPFSIRCVEVADEHDQGDTVGSVIRGFLAVRSGPGRSAAQSDRAQARGQSDRLPTSSTCFNLLKLPNYSSKQTLREKLKYAIHSQTGFELS